MVTDRCDDVPTLVRQLVRSLNGGKSSARLRSVAFTSLLAQTPPLPDVDASLRTVTQRTFDLRRHNQTVTADRIDILADRLASTSPHLLNFLACVVAKENACHQDEQCLLGSILPKGVFHRASSTNPEDRVALGIHQETVERRLALVNGAAPVYSSFSADLLNGTSRLLPLDSGDAARHAARTSSSSSLTSMKSFFQLTSSARLADQPPLLLDALVQRRAHIDDANLMTLQLPPLPRHPHHHHNHYYHHHYQQQQQPEEEQQQPMREEVKVDGALPRDNRFLSETSAEHWTMVTGFSLLDTDDSVGLLRAIVHVLMGVGSACFEWSLSRDAFQLCDYVSLSASDRHLLAEFASCGSSVAHLERRALQFQESGMRASRQAVHGRPQAGVSSAVAHSLRAYLLHYRQQMYAQLARGPSPLHLSLAVRPLAQQIDALLAAVGEKSLLSDADLLSRIYEHTQCCNARDAPALHRLFVAALAPYVQRVSDWVFRGDPSSGIVRVASEHVHALSDLYWLRAFSLSLDSVPVFLRSVAHLLLDVGRSVHLLTRHDSTHPLAWRHDAPVMLLLDHHDALARCEAHLNQFQRETRFDYERRARAAVRAREGGAAGHTTESIALMMEASQARVKARIDMERAQVAREQEREKQEQRDEIEAHLEERRTVRAAEQAQLDAEEAASRQQALELQARVDAERERMLQEHAQRMEALERKKLRILEGAVPEDRLEDEEEKEVKIEVEVEKEVVEEAVEEVKEMARAGEEERECKKKKEEEEEEEEEEEKEKGEKEEEEEDGNGPAEEERLELVGEHGVVDTGESVATVDPTLSWEVPSLDVFDEAPPLVSATVSSPPESTIAPTLDVMLRRSVRNMIVLHQKHVSHACTVLLRDELHLMSHLSLLRDNALLHDGVYARVLVEELTVQGYHAHNNRLAVERRRGVLTRLFSRAREASATFESRQRDTLTGNSNGRQLTLTTNEKTTLLLVPAESTRHLQLTYTPPWPISILFGATILDKYNTIFRFLVNLRATRHALLVTRRHLQRRALSAAVSAAQLRPIDMLRREMEHVVSVLDAYVLHHTLHVAWAVFQKDLKQASGVGGLLRAHHHYLDTILFGALLTPKARPVLDVVEVLLSCVVALRAQLELVSATQETGGGWTGEQYARLMDTRETFRSGVAFLFKVLKKLARNSVRAAQFEDLLLRLNFNGFYGEQ